jgi:signal peptidase I
MFTRILKNKIFRVCLVLIIIIFPFSSKYRFVKTVGPSMEPTLQDGEWVIVERKSSLGEFWFPRRLDNVIIKDQEENLSKRVIGLAGDIIEIKKGVIYLNEKKLQDPFGKGEISFYLVDENDNNLKYWSGPEAGEDVVSLVSQAAQRVPVGFAWVIGDNRKESWYGLLPLENIVGKVLY